MILRNRLDVYPFLPLFLAAELSSCGEPCQEADGAAALIDDVQVMAMNYAMLDHRPTHITDEQGRVKFERIYLLSTSYEQLSWKLLGRVRPDHWRSRGEKPLYFKLCDGESIGQAASRIGAEDLHFIVSVSNTFHSMSVRFRNGRASSLAVESYTVRLYTEPQSVMNVIRFPQPTRRRAAA